MTRRFVSFDGIESSSGELAQPDRYRDLLATLEDARAGAPANRLFDGYDDFKTRLEDFDPKRRLDSALRGRFDV